MKNILLYTLLLTATLSYGQGLLPEEKIRKEPPAQPVHQAKKYDWIGGYYEGLASVKLNGKWGFIDKTGKEVIPLIYDKVWHFEKNRAWVKIGDKYGFINSKGEEITPFNEEKYWNFSEGLAMAKLNHKYGFIDKTGKEVISIKYNSACDFLEGLAKVELNGKVFYINQKGEYVKDCDNTSYLPKKGFFSKLFDNINNK